MEAGSLSGAPIIIWAEAYMMIATEISSMSSVRIELNGAKIGAMSLLYQDSTIEEEMDIEIEMDMVETIIDMMMVIETEEIVPAQGVVETVEIDFLDPGIAVLKI